MISLLWLFLIGAQASLFLSDEAEILDGGLLVLIIIVGLEQIQAL